MGKKTMDWRKPGDNPVKDLPGQQDLFDQKSPETPPPSVPATQEAAPKMEVADPKEFGFDFRENFQGGAVPRLPQIGIVSAAQMFKCGEQKFESFEGNILHYQLCSAWWEKPIEEGAGSLPDCASSNAITPDSGDKLQAKHCSECPMNKFGSDPKDGRGKWCKNMMRLHVLVKGDAIPSRLTLPATSIRVADDFFSDLFKRKIAYQVAVVKFSLEKTKNANGIEYSKIKFETKETITHRDDMLILREYVDKFRKSFGEKLLVEETGIEHGGKPAESY